ncbi:MAG: PPC domain-containing protein [Pirellulaceae bacterium]
MTVPEIEQPRQAKLTVITSAGRSEAHPLLVGTDFPLIREQEPNDGFHQAQPIASSQAIVGTTQADRDVDVFVLDGSPGDSVEVEVLAVPFGSALDSILTVYDASGNIIKANDDADLKSESPGSDSVLKFEIGQTGRFYICLQDAHDRGGPAHPWLINVRTTR